MVILRFTVGPRFTTCGSSPTLATALLPLGGTISCWCWSWRIRWHRILRGHWSGLVDWFSNCGDTEIRHVCWVSAATFWPRAAAVPIHPIHVLISPIARHENHAFIHDSFHHIQFRVWPHCFNNPIVSLDQRRVNDQVLTLCD